MERQNGRGEERSDGARSGLERQKWRGVTWRGGSGMDRRGRERIVEAEGDGSGAESSGEERQKWNGKEWIGEEWNG